MLNLSGINAQMPDIFSHYDTNQSGYVEGEEISVSFNFA